MTVPAMSEPIRHFWVSSGHLLLDRDADGRLVVTDEYLRAYLARPELMPPEDACNAERALHASLLAEPRRDVAAAEIAALTDADARENWTFAVALRDRLVVAPTIEDAYAGLVRDGGGGLPPIFLDQLVHVILRNALDECDDPFTVRAAETFYRPQRVTFHDGRILLADADAIEKHEHDRHASPLLAMLGDAAVTELDVLVPGNADGYWARSDAFDMVLDLGGEPGGRKALASAIETFVRHMHRCEVKVEALERIEDPDWRWFVGLSPEATRIGNAIWRGEAKASDLTKRILGLFKLTLPADAPVVARAAGHPVYLLLANGAEDLVRLKPQNLIDGLPLIAAEPIAGRA